MSRLVLSLVLGIASGAASWIVVPLVSNRIEPFDSDVGFWIGQFLMSTAGAYLGFTHGIKSVIFFIVGAYAGLNLYPYIFGSSEQRAWATLGLVVSTLLCVLPLVAGLCGVIAKRWKMKYNNSLKSDAAKPRASS